MYHFKAGGVLAEQQCLEEAAEGGDLADVHLRHGLDAALRRKLETLLDVPLEQLHQVRTHRLRHLRAHAVYFSVCRDP